MVKLVKDEFLQEEVVKLYQEQGEGKKLVRKKQTVEMIEGGIDQNYAVNKLAGMKEREMITEINGLKKSQGIKK